MKKIEEIIKLGSSIDDKIERNLYYIKSNNFIFDANFKKNFNFEFICNDKKDKLKNDKIITMDNEVYVVENQCRIINFIIDGISCNRFIYSCSYLKKIFYDLDIKFYSTQKNQLNNSLESDISDKEIRDIFYDDKIKTIFKKKSDDIKKEENLNNLFKNRYNLNRDIISSLSLNAGSYYPENSKDEFDLNIFDSYIFNFKNLIWDDNVNIIYMIGPKGTSKSIFLMNFCLVHNLEKNPTLYINYKYVKNLDKNKKKCIFKKEIVYLFFNSEQFKDFYIKRYHHIIVDEKNSFIKNIKLFLKLLINIFENYFQKKITIILDNFDDSDENIFSEIDEIINLVNTNPAKLRLIISGHSDYIKKKFELFLINKSFSSIIEKQALFIHDLQLKDNKEIKSLPLFNYKKIPNENDLENILLIEEKEYCKKYNLYGMHYSILNEGKNLELEQLRKYLIILPWDYLSFNINEDKSITFKFFNPIFLNAIKNSIKSEIKEKSLEFLLSNDNKDYLINGIYEEKLLTTLISYNKLNLNNMSAPENNILEVNKIIEFKDSIITKTDKKVDVKSPIIITQTIFLGELYDLLVLIPNPEEESSYTLYMIQIGVNKRKEQIEEIEGDFKENKQNYI